MQSMLVGTILRVVEKRESECLRLWSQRHSVAGVGVGRAEQITSLLKQMKLGQGAEGGSLHPASQRMQENVAKEQHSECRLRWSGERGASEEPCSLQSARLKAQTVFAGGGNTKSSIVLKPCVAAKGCLFLEPMGKSVSFASSSTYTGRGELKGLELCASAPDDWRIRPASCHGGGARKAHTCLLCQGSHGRQGQFSWARGGLEAYDHSEIQAQQLEWKGVSCGCCGVMHQREDVQCASLLFRFYRSIRYTESVPTAIVRFLEAKPLSSTSTQKTLMERCNCSAPVANCISSCRIKQDRGEEHLVKVLQCLFQNHKRNTLLGEFS